MNRLVIKYSFSYYIYIYIYIFLYNNYIKLLFINIIIKLDKSEVANLYYMYNYAETIVFLHTFE